MAVQFNAIWEKAEEIRKALIEVQSQIGEIKGY